MAINVSIKRNNNEQSVMVLKRFTRKVQETGVIQKLKSKRYNDRAHSKLKTKKDKLVKLESHKKYEHLKKMGKLQVKTYRTQREAPAQTQAQAPKENTNADSK